ncbi:hypothetical protein [Nodularia spumigena]|uniref:hypothetical protein n=1 Tax=Nodularia spumigena TaxID=70799 RepID=UPI002B1F0B5F|nr:hypothetical protein [Nodularia spumigena]MEA5559349.1 hypothetical protein [Nodularia spumigena CH309]
MITRTEQTELTDLLDQALEVLAKIKNHRDFKAVEYSPDVTVGDAEQALIELRWETLPKSPRLNIFALESFTN